MPAAPVRPRLPALTSIRFLAALHVFFFHIHTVRANDATTHTSDWIGRLAALGYLGVSFFFVLSGFILVYTYGERTLHVRRFWRARFARIYPAYAFSLIATQKALLVCLLAPLSANAIALGTQWLHRHPPLSIISVAGLFQSWIPNMAMAWNPVAWSLSCEAFFYACFPLLMILLRKRSTPVLVAIAALCWITLLGVASAYVLVAPDGQAHVTSDDLGLTWLNLIKFNPLVRLPEFVMGMVCGLWFLRDSKRRNMTPVILAAIALFAIAVQFSARIPYPILHTGLLAPLFAVVVLGLAYRPAWSRVVENRVFVLLGDASYSFYLLHATIITSAMSHLYRTSPAFAHSTVAAAVPLTIAVAVSVAVYLLVEQPARRKLAGRPSDARALVAAA
jgi:peptidoglycan/LPS O-acetylase OafA/YrhL